ncbi:hypothetical protein [Mesorhizobium sp.]|uniref:hypothetical protein n=1 Tax=Mesorhizobium sp. TaxID=1871066 RepID=UPI000FE37ABB|nr:hypothetical protein [Mesorhizobium sp.]RWI35517.1 MAG: hypothetical protein EOR14_28865 [Mesorhizobium sp.]RWJ03453.1 MAG: hypothetical protein EOR24_32245 [Mesorhizobium sp.]RWJ66314.1 MAG: hypothetical protein EOR34_28270 [Mesorhizobium sp.]
MERADFLTHAGSLHDFILDSIEEFITGSGLPFDRAEFLRFLSTDLAQCAVEALFFGAGAYSPADELIPVYRVQCA